MNYLELKAEAERLMAEAEIARRSEVRVAITEIKSLMLRYGLTVDDLRVPRAAVRDEAPAILYLGPAGERWTGGRGRKPLWVQAVLDSGGDIERFRVSAPAKN